MARVNIGLILNVDFDDADELVEKLRHTPNVNLIHVQQSCGRLWIQKGEPL